MTGSVIIDGIDIYNTYNATLMRGGDVDLLYWPARKEPDVVSYFEESGYDIDLEDLALESKDVTMLFYLKANSSSELLRIIDSFYARLLAPGYRSIYLRELDKSFELRYLSTNNYAQRGPLSQSGAKSAKLEVSFANDFPEQMYVSTFTSPLSTSLNSTYVEINDIDLSFYSLVVKDVYTTALALPPIKPPLVLESDYSSGRYADSFSAPTLEPFDIVISVAARSYNVNQFYNNMSALFAELTSDTLIDLTLSAANKTYKCYYVQMQNVEKKHSFNPSVHLTFDIVLKSVSYDLLSYLLGSEQQQAIITEDNKLIILS